MGKRTQYLVEYKVTGGYKKCAIACGILRRGSEAADEDHAVLWNLWREGNERSLRCRPQSDQQMEEETYGQWRKACIVNPSTYSSQKDTHAAHPLEGCRLYAIIAGNLSGNRQGEDQASPGCVL